MPRLAADLALAQLFGADREAFFGAQGFDQYRQHSVLARQKVVELVDDLGQAAHDVERRGQRAPDAAAPGLFGHARQCAQQYQGRDRREAQALVCVEHASAVAAHGAQQQELFAEATAAADRFLHTQQLIGGTFAQLLRQRQGRGVLRQEVGFGKSDQPLFGKVWRFAQGRQLVDDAADLRAELVEQAARVGEAFPDVALGVDQQNRRVAVEQELERFPARVTLGLVAGRRLPPTAWIVVPDDVEAGRRQLVDLETEAQRIEAVGADREVTALEPVVTRQQHAALRSVSGFQPVAVTFFEGVALLVAEIAGEQGGLASALHAKQGDAHFGPAWHGPRS